MPPAKKRSHSTRDDAVEGNGAVRAAVDQLPIPSQNLSFLSQLALTNPGPVKQSCIKQSEYIRVPPVTSVRPDSKLFDFQLPIASDACWDLSNMRVVMSYSIEDDTGKKVGPFATIATGGTVDVAGVDQGAGDPRLFDPVAVCNSIAQSAFGRVEISINDVFVNSTCGLHHHRAFILNSVNYTMNARNSHLTLAGFHQDSPTPESTAKIRNGGMATRAKDTENGAVSTVYGKLSHDLLSLTRVLPVGTKVGVRLHKNSDELILMVDHTNEYHQRKRYHMMVNSIELEVLRLRLEPETISILEASLANSCAKYHFPRLELRTFYIPPGAMSHMAQNIFVSQSPTRLFLGFVTTEEFQGTYNTNPLCYRPHNISYLALKRDNRLEFPILRPSWENPSGYLDVYVQYLKSLRMLNRADEVEPRFDTFGSGPLCLFAWDLAADLSEASISEKVGSVSLDVRFSTKAPDSGLVAVVLGVFNASLFIDKFGGVAVFDEAIDKTEAIIMK